MDCKAVQQAILDFDDLDDHALDAEFRKHISSCRECGREWEWMVALRRDLKGLTLPKPGPEFWEAMPRRIQCKLMLGASREHVSISWVQTIAEWISLPRFAYGFTALAAAFIVAMWAVPFSNTSQPTLTSPPKYETASYTAAPTVSLDPTITRTLETMNDADLNKCMTKLIHQAFDRRELATIASDPVVLADNDMTADDGIYRLGNHELQQVAYLLNQKYPQ
jgi:hypothetical protein